MCELVDVVGPLNRKELRENVRRERVEEERVGLVVRRRGGVCLVRCVRRESEAGKDWVNRSNSRPQHSMTSRS